MKVPKPPRLAWLAFPLSKAVYWLVAARCISEPRGTLAVAAILAVAGISCAIAGAACALAMIGMGIRTRRSRGRRELRSGEGRGRAILYACCLVLAEISSLSGLALSIVTADIGNYGRMLLAAAAAWILAELPAG